VRLELGGSPRDLALFNTALDSKLRACDLVRLRIDDVCNGFSVRDRATVVQKKTGRPVQFEITEQTRTAIEQLFPELNTVRSTFLFPNRRHSSTCLSTRQYARIVHAGSV
jgi:integrase